MGYMFLGIVGVSILGIAYRLNIYYIMVANAALLLLVPTIVVNAYRRKYQENRFVDAIAYIETMLYAFKRQPKVLDSLKETATIFEQSNLKSYINQAIHFMEHTYYEGDRSERALEFIYEAYPNRIIKQIHQYFVKVENIGGKYELAIQAMLEDKLLWQKRCAKNKEACRTWKRNTVIAIVLSLMVCTFTIYTLPNSLSLTEIPIYQLNTLLSFVIYLLLYIKVDGELLRDYITSRSTSDEMVLKRYHRVELYMEKREQWCSFFYAAIPFAGTVLCMWVRNIPLSIMGGTITVLLINQHKIGYYLNKKSVTEAVECAFPQWLLNIALLLQVENVQTAIVKSYEYAPEIIKPEVEKLIEALSEDPKSIEPYIKFLKEYQNSEILFSMKLLYSFTVSNIGDAQKQIAEIIERSNWLRDRAEIRQNESQLAVMNGLFLLPVLVAGFKLLIDMTMFMFLFIQKMQV